jgi:transcription elongation factor GreB
MSRGFVKEDDQEEIPFVAPRAHLPAGATNYVTPKGMEALLAEKNDLLLEKDKVESHNENDKRVAVNHINARLSLLDERINSARVIKLEDQPKHEVRFGATVEIRTLSNGEVQTLQITGVDEADISNGKISFLSPLAKLLVNKKVGDKIVLKRPKDEVIFEVVSIKYA